MEPMKKATERFAPFLDIKGRKTWASHEQYNRELDRFCDQHPELSVPTAVRKWYEMEGHWGPGYFERMIQAGHGPLPQPFIREVMGTALRRKIRLSRKKETPVPVKKRNKVGKEKRGRRTGRRGNK